MTGGQYHRIDHIDELPALAARMSLAVHDHICLATDRRHPASRGHSVGLM
jgi:hypothetical protein